MKTIWKFTVPVADRVQIKIEGATLVEILSAEISSEISAKFAQDIDIWAVVDVHPGSMEFVPIEIRGTGHPLHAERFSHYNPKYPDEPCAKNSFIGTVRDGIFVWHVFRGGVFE